MRHSNHNESVFSQVESLHRSNQFHFSFEVTSAITFESRNLGKKLVDARNNLIDMHLIQSLKNEFCFDLPLFSRYPATSIKSYFYKITLTGFILLFTEVTSAISF